MEKTEFKISKLTKKEQTGYLAMDEKQQAAFERKWIALEKAKAEMDEKILQANRRAKAKEARDKEAKRRADTHRKIENGALLEAVLKVHGADYLIEKDPGQKENEQLKEFLIYCLELPEVAWKIQDL